MLLSLLVSIFLCTLSLLQYCIIKYSPLSQRVIKQRVTRIHPLNFIPVKVFPSKAVFLGQKHTLLFHHNFLNRTQTLNFILLTCGHNILLFSKDKKIKLIIQIFNIFFKLCVLTGITNDAYC